MRKGYKGGGMTITWPHIKPSADNVLQYLRHRGEFVTSTEIVKYCYTTTPSKRLSELRKAKLITSRQHKGREQEYRALTMQEILMGRPA
jgi:hypothetical protein